jgi:hypothetical protein
LKLASFDKPAGGIGIVWQKEERKEGKKDTQVDLEENLRVRE